MTVVDPRGNVGGIASTLSKQNNPPDWPQKLNCAKIGLLSNGKPNIASFFAQLADDLKTRDAAVTCSLIKPGPTTPAGEERIAQLVASADIVITGVCDGGTATSWGVNDALSLVSRGIPVVLVCTQAFIQLAKSMLPRQVHGLRILVIPHPFSSLNDRQVDALATATAPQLRAYLQKNEALGDYSAGESDKSELKDAQNLLNDEAEASDKLYACGWTDGLPAFVPTRDRVNRAIKDWRYSNQTELSLLVPPRHGIATQDAIAANAVMTGMPPALLPYLLAAIEACCNPEFNLFGIQTTTNPTTPALIVGGPHSREDGFNDGLGALGPGNIANATLGRALRLCLQNLGGGSARAGTDPATLGQPGKYVFCLAEDESANPWQPLRMQVGKKSITVKDDAVTVMAATGTTNMIIKSRTGEEFMDMLAGSINGLGSNDYMFGGHPLLILCPEHAAILARDGWSLADIQQRIFDTTKFPFSAFLPKNQEMTIAPRSHEFDRFDPDTMIPLVAQPSDFLVCVAGGPSMHSTFVPSFGGSTPATAKVRLNR
jgi:hypothetical protein